MARRLARLPESHERHLFENESIVPEPMPPLVPDHRTAKQKAAGIDPDDGTPKTEPIGRRKGETAGAAAVARQAKAELENITGLDADRVSSVVQKPDGWHVTVDLVELRRIPAATDVIAAYDAVLGPTGELLSYRRTRRYLRDQMFEDS
jgi:gas vesicle protein GvpO